MPSTEDEIAAVEIPKSLIPGADSKILSLVAWLAILVAIFWAKNTFVSNAKYEENQRTALIETKEAAEKVERSNAAVVGNQNEILIQLKGLSVQMNQTATLEKRMDEYSGRLLEVEKHDRWHANP